MKDPLLDWTKHQTGQFAHVVKRVAIHLDKAEHRANVRMKYQLQNPRTKRKDPYKVYPKDKG
jgi:hypothetical protein